MAWRNIWRNKMRSFVIAFSIASGLFAGIAVLSLYKGMIKDRVRITIDTEVGHLQLHDSNFKKDYEAKYVIANGEDVLKKIEKIPEVKMAVQRTITMGMLSTTTGSSGVKINGIVPEKEYLASQLKNRLLLCFQCSHLIQNWRHAKPFRRF